MIFMAVFIQIVRDECLGAGKTLFEYRLCLNLLHNIVTLYLKSTMYVQSFLLIWQLLYYDYLTINAGFFFLSFFELYDLELKVFCINSGFNAWLALIFVRYCLYFLLIWYHIQCNCNYNSKILSN